MTGLGQVIDETPSLRAMLASPLISAHDAAAGLRAALSAAGFSGLILRFAGVVAVNRRLAVLHGIIGAFADLVAEKRGIVAAHVTSAYALTDGQRDDLRARLSEAGYTRVTIVEDTDPALLGGLTVRIGARLLDTSIKSRLQRLQYAMKGAA
jgi:F-type H+-transporting ATPase subunit delta